jgi:tetratricopeptide (TPR) repeat protein/nucleoside phosphorylase
MMDESDQMFDVCIVCALPEETRAFLEMVAKYSGGKSKEFISQRYGYSCRCVTLHNSKEEPLHLHISWPSRYGPQEMTLHLERVLSEYQPRLVLMTGFCAGDSQQVHLGDIVVAERTFTYDNGKYMLDEQGRSVHLHNVQTYQLDANILQFLGLFDDWKPFVASLHPPLAVAEQREVVCHLKAMASGNAVREDHPFDDIRMPVLGTVAIDMESAALGLVMSRYPAARWLVVKGVCDYADGAKNDVYHHYAACVSALYALNFLTVYVTSERFPRCAGPASRAGPAGVCNVPYLRNPHFTGREDLLVYLDRQLAPPGPGDTTARRAALTQSQAVKGLGGIGKTQIAVEYAYRSRERDRYTHIFWVNAAEETLLSSFLSLAEILPAFSEKQETDQLRMVAAIKRWLEQCQESWLLILDNADTIELIGAYLPGFGRGSILLTTRADAVGPLGGAAVEVQTMGMVEGISLLLSRAQRLSQAHDDDINQAGNIVVALDHFPLALDQAGAYIDEAGCSLADYLQIYQEHRQALLARRGQQFTAYPDSVATTWLLSFEKVEQANPAAAELLRLCAFLSPDQIPEELIREGAEQWSPLLRKAATDLFAFNQMIIALLTYSLVKRLSDHKTLSIHRLVQAVQRDQMEPEIQNQWAKRVVQAVHTVFPENAEDLVSWPRCLRFLDQAQACSSLIEHYQLGSVDAANLLNRTGIYFNAHALYAIAEPLYRRALSIREQQVGEAHADTAQSLNNLAELLQAQGMYAEAGTLYRRALTIYEQELEALDHPGAAACLNNLAELSRTQGAYTEAEAFYRRALAIYERHLGAEHPRFALSLNNLAGLCKAQGRYEAAEVLYQQALSIREKQLGDQHPDTAGSLNNLALLFYEQGKYLEAGPLYHQAFAIYEHTLGANHPDTVSCLNNLALLFSKQGKYDEAEPLYRRALSTYERVYGVNHPDTAVGLNNLAALYTSQGRYTDAEPLYQQALTIAEEALGVDHPDTATGLSNLAEFYRTLGRYTEAEPLCQRAYAISVRRLGAQHPDTAGRLSNLARLFSVQGKHAEAEPLYSQALVMLQQALGATHPDVAVVLNNLAALYTDQGRYREAEPLYLRALTIKEQALGVNHPSIASVLSNMVEIYKAQEKDAAAEQLCRRALAIRVQALGVDHPSTALSLNTLAELYTAQGKYTDAEPFYRQAYRILKNTLGPDHPNTLAVCQSYALHCSALKDQ